MKRGFGRLAVGCLCMAMAGSMTSYAEIQISVHPTTLVAAPEDYENIAVSQVTDYVNVREAPNTGSSIVGKIYNNCAASILETVSGEGGDWYHIQSGSVTGYIMAQYFITGTEAQTLALQIGKEYVTIAADGLRLREQPDLNSTVLTNLSNGEHYLVQSEEGDFYKIEVDADLTGYVAKQYCKVTVEFDQAVSLEEERQKQAEEEQRKQDAESAMAALEQAQAAMNISPAEYAALVEQAKASAGSDSSQKPGKDSGETEQETQAASDNSGVIAANPLPSDNSASVGAPSVEKPSGQQSASAQAGNPDTSASSGSASAVVTAGPNVSSEAVAVVTSATRTAIVAYAKQFLGNPYVYGGTSLTNGTDCSGFTQAIYAHFGIKTGRSSRDQAANGKNISVSAAQPGDLLFYSSGSYINHVAMYIGNGKIIHAASRRSGICIANYDYRTPCKAVTFLN